MSTAAAFARTRPRPMISSRIRKMREKKLHTALSKLQTNTIFNGRYKIVKKMDDVGGMAKLFVAFDPRLMRDIVLKTTDMSKLEKYYQAETKVLEQDLHPMFPTHIESGKCGEVTFIAMEKINGLTLKALIRKEEAIPLYQAIEITMSVLYGLKILHQNGERVHRDIKPENIMVEHNGATRLIDFGLAVAEGHQEEDGSVVGTPTYLSPEQAKSKAIRNNSDIYSLGLVLFEMMTSYKPGKPTHSLESVHFHRADDRTVPPISQRVVKQRIAPEQRKTLSRQIDQAHEQLNNIIQAMTAKDPTARYQEVDKVITQLERLRTIAKELKPFEISN